MNYMTKNIKEEVDVLGKDSVSKGDVKNTNEGNVKSNTNGKFKSGVVQKLVNKVKSLKNKIKGKDEIKEKSTISLGDLMQDIDNMSDSDIKNICDDIKSMDIKVGMDAKTIQFLSKNKDNENVKKLLRELNMSMSIDVSSMAQFRKSDVDNVRSICKETGCNIDKVYVNTGWDKAAKQGYSFDKYDKIVGNAEKMLNSALKKLPENASTQDKVMAIYNAVLKVNKYDYSALKKNSSKEISSRNLEGFFLNGGSCVCAGTATAFQNLCECEGINVEYVQGMAGKNNKEYHAWVKVQLDDGKWYNCDPTWDANKVGKKYEYCLKSDKNFPHHNEDKSYNPTYERGTNSQRFISSTRTYKTSNHETSISSKYLRDTYRDSDVDKALQITYDLNQNKTVDEEYLNYARENNIPINIGSAGTVAPKMSFKQKLAEFLRRSKHFKNISFVKKFIEKNIAISNNEKITDVPIQNTATQLYKVDSQQIHYIAKSQKTVPTQEQNKEQNER
mgnify:CR=1 FL=1